MLTSDEACYEMAKKRPWWALLLSKPFSKKRAASHNRCTPRASMALHAEKGTPSGPGALTGDLGLADQRLDREGRRASSFRCTR